MYAAKKYASTCSFANILEKSHFLLRKMQTKVLEYAPQFVVDLLSARVVKLVDTRDLKSLALWVCRFDSGSGHQIQKRPIP